MRSSNALAIETDGQRIQDWQKSGWIFTCFNVSVPLCDTGVGTRAKSGARIESFFVLSSRRFWGEDSEKPSTSRPSRVRMEAEEEESKDEQLSECLLLECWKGRCLTHRDASLSLSLYFFFLVL